MPFVAAERITARCPALAVQDATVVARHTQVRFLGRAIGASAAKESRRGTTRFCRGISAPAARGARFDCPRAKPCFVLDY